MTKKTNFSKAKKAIVIGSIGFAGFMVGKSLFNKSEEQEYESGTFGAYREMIKPITPFLIVDLISKEGVNVNKQGLHTPYRCSMGVPTIGFGSTKLKDGTRVTMNSQPITTDEAYELARWHLEDSESYFLLYCYDTAFDEIDINSVTKAFGMGSVIYNSYSKVVEEPEDKNHKNRMAELRNIYKEYGFGVPDSLVLKCFKKYPVVAPRSFGEAWIKGESDKVLANKLGEFLAGGSGVQWRRWLEAGVITGDVTPEMLLDCPIHGMYEFYKVQERSRSAFFTGKAGSRKVNRKTYSVFKEWLKNPVDDKGVSLKKWKKIRDYLPPEILEICENNKVALGTRKSVKINPIQKKEEINTYVLGYADFYKAAVSAHKNKDYKSAAQQFEALIAQHPDNALLRNDLSDTYNKLGRYDDAITQAREIVKRIGDKSQYGAANYNAGFAYEQQCKLESALKNYKLAVANGNKKVQKDVTRVAERMKSNLIVKSGRDKKHGR